MRGAGARATARRNAASPITQLHPAFPPTIILHATADKLVDIRSSVTLHQRPVELGVPADLHIYADRDHESDMEPSMTAATIQATTSFLERPVTHREENEIKAHRFAFPPAEQPDIPT